MAAGFALALALLVVALRGAPQPLASPADPGAAPAVDSAYGSLPLGFAPAAGSEADYVASADGGSVALSSGVVRIVPAEAGSEPLQMTLAGAARVEPVAMAKLPGVLNDLRGNDPTAWRTEVPTFARIRYAGVYPGIALDFHGTTGTLEYDFRVAPGSDPAQIAVDFGDTPLRVTGRGALVVGEGPGRLRQAPPVAFQPSAGGRIPVESAFSLSDGRVTFDVGHYDRMRPLVIDPLLLSYSTFLGGSTGDGDAGQDLLEDIAIDPNGNAYVAGYTSSTDYPTTSGVHDRTRGGATDVIVAKLNPTGSGLVYSTLIGGSGIDFARDIAIDDSGNAFVTGETSSTGEDVTEKYPTTSGAFGTTVDDRQGDVFVTKLNPNGSGLVYSSVFGGDRGDSGLSIALDATGAAYVGGESVSGANVGGVPFPTAGGFDSSYGGNSADGFVAKLNPAGSSLVYSSYLGGNGQDEVHGVDVDSQGRLYATGFTAAYSNNDFPTTNSRYEPADLDSADAFLSRVSADGSTLEYSTAIGADGSGPNSGADYAYGVAAGPSDGVAYITGTSTGGVFDLKREYEGRNGQCCYANDLFVSKFDTSASGAGSLVYSTLIGGSGTEAGLSIAVDSEGAAYVGGVTGNATGDRYDTTPDELGTPSTRGTAIVTKVNQTGIGNASLGFSTTIPNGGFGGDEVYGIAVDDETSDVYVTGVSKGNAPLQTTSGAYQTTHPGGWDGFVAKITSGNAPPDTTPPATTITSGPTGGSTVTSSQVSFGFSSNEAGSTFECSYDSAPFAPCTSPGPGQTGSDTRSLGNGVHTFSVRARDAAGNVDASPASRTFTVSAVAPDTTPPATAITSGPAAGSTVRSASVTFAFNSSEAGSTFECSYDSAPFAPCTSDGPGTSGSHTSTLAEGTHTFEVRARDAAGNVDATPESRSFAVDLPNPPPVDRTPPQTTVTKAPRKLVKTRQPPATVSVSFASSETGSTFICRVDDGRARNCTSPASFALGKGKHTIAIAARDRAGNVDASPATVKVRVKKKKPRKGGR